jgi:hypothetical protein
MSLLERYPNAIFLDYNKVIENSTSFDYINQKLSKVQMRLSSIKNFNKILMKPSKNHGNPVKNANEAKNQYINNQQIVSNFLNNKPKFKRSIKHILIKYYLNKYFY